MREHINKNAPFPYTRKQGEITGNGIRHSNEERISAPLLFENIIGDTCHASTMPIRYRCERRRRHERKRRRPISAAATRVVGI